MPARHVMIAGFKNWKRRMAECNYCRLKQICRDAKRDGLKVSVLSGVVGQIVYVHPTTVRIRALTGGENGSRKRYFSAWLAEVPNGCEC